MSSIKYGILLWKKNLAFSLLVMFLVFVTVVLLNAALLYLFSVNKTYNLCRDLLKMDGGYYMLNHDTTNESVLQQYGDEIDILRVARAHTNINGDSIEIQGADSQLLDLLSFPIRGEMPGALQDANVIPVITSNDKIGTEYEVFFGFYGEIPAILRVVGTMGSNYPYFDMAGGDAVTDVFRWADGSTQKKFICSKDALLSITEEAISYKSASFVKFNNNVSDDRQAEIELGLKQVGSYYPIDSLKTSATELTSQMFSMMLPVGFVVFLLAVINYLMCAVLTNSKNKKMLAILYVSGAKRNNLLTAVLSYGFIMSFVPSALAITIFLGLNPLKFMGGGGGAKSMTIVISLGICAVFMLLCLLSFAMTVKQKQISSILKGEA